MDEKNIEIQMDEKNQNGVFSNLAIINHSDSEFVFDFIYLQPNIPKGKVQSRVIMTPSHAKKFFLALNDNLEKFQKKYNEIKIYQPSEKNDSKK